MTSIPEKFSSQAQQWVPLVLIGSLAGLLASIPMAGVMVGLNRILPGRKQSLLDRLFALPPKKVTASLARRSGLGEIVKPGRSWDVPTWLMHLGYGAATASLYPVITRPLHLPRIIRGMMFALGVWGMSYLGWLPAANILPPATKEPARRNAIIITSHLVWGSLIGLLVGWFTNLQTRVSHQGG